MENFLLQAAVVLIEWVPEEKIHGRTCLKRKPGFTSTTFQKLFVIKANLFDKLAS